MSWIGKLIGGACGFVMGGPIGAALGAALGHQFDMKGLELRLENSGFGPQDSQRVQSAFFSATFQVMGHIAKADGRVAESQIDAARNVMNRMMLTEELKRTAIRLYRQGKREDFPFDEVTEQFRDECRGRTHLFRMFIALQTEAALAGNGPRPAGDSLLLRLCDILQFSRYEYFGMRTRLEAERRFSGFSQRGQQDHFQRQQYQYRQQHHYEPPLRPRETSLGEAYSTLGLTAAASDSEIKKAYRRLISQYHPDKLAAQTVSQDKIKKATEQTQKVQKAYDAICKARKI